MKGANEQIEKRGQSQQAGFWTGFIRHNIRNYLQEQNINLIKLNLTFTTISISQLI